jgi:hypothetical protein
MFGSLKIEFAARLDGRHPAALLNGECTSLAFGYEVLTSTLVNLLTSTLENFGIGHESR